MCRWKEKKRRARTRSAGVRACRLTMSRAILRRQCGVRRAGGGSALPTPRMRSGIRACRRREKRAARHRAPDLYSALSSTSSLCPPCLCALCVNSFPSLPASHCKRHTFVASLATRHELALSAAEGSLTNDPGVSSFPYFRFPYFSGDKRKESSDRGPPSSGKQKLQGWVTSSPISGSSIARRGGLVGRVKIQ